MKTILLRTLALAVVLCPSVVFTQNKPTAAPAAPVEPCGEQLATLPPGGTPGLIAL